MCNKSNSIIFHRVYKPYCLSLDFGEIREINFSLFLKVIKWIIHNLKVFKMLFQIGDYNNLFIFKKNHGKWVLLFKINLSTIVIN